MYICSSEQHCYVLQPNAKCPLCRKEVGLEQLVECPLEDSDDTTKSDQEWVSSSKVNNVLGFSLL